MYNWRLLLLAFFAVFQPIASFTERNLVDGREQCCDHRLERDSSYSLYGNTRFKLPSEDRRLINQRREIREDRRYDNAGLARLEIDSLRDFKGRENRRSLELGSRSSRTEPQRERESHAQIRNGIVSEDRERVTRDVLRNTRTDRVRVAISRRDILSQDSRANQINRDSGLRLTRDAVDNVYRVAIERSSVGSPREARHMQNEIQRNRDSRETRFELRRTRSSLIQSDRPTGQYDRRIEHGDSLELRVREGSQFERNQRSVRSADRLSRSNEYRFSLERNGNDERTERNNVRNDIERRSIEMRLRERVELERRITSRSISAPRQLDNNRDRRSVSSIRREHEFRVSTNVGERAYEVDELRNNVRDALEYRSERRDTRERDDYERRSTAQLRYKSDNTRQRSDDRSLSADRRSNRNIRNIREDTREQRDDLRSSRIEGRRSRDLATKRMALSESRLTENNREDRVLDNRDREIDESRRTAGNRIARYRDTRDETKEIARERYESRITDYQRSQIRNNDVQQQRRDETRELRERTSRFRESLTSEQRAARENQRMETARNSRSETDERQRDTRQFRENTIPESSRLSLRMNARDIARHNEKRSARENQRMEATRNSRSESDERQRDMRQLRENPTAESSRLSLRMNARDYERRETQRSDRVRDASRDHISSRRIESRARFNTETAGNRVAAISQKTVETENQNYTFNWQYLIFTLQGIYLCSIFMPMLAKNDSKKTKNIGWWSPFQSVIKTD